MTSKNSKTITTAEFKKKVLHYLNIHSVNLARPIDRKALLRATSSSINDLIFTKLQATNIKNRDQSTRCLNYLSLEYLMGRMLSNNLHNLGLYQTAHKVIQELGFELEDIIEEGYDLALGNGGLGRLAACYLDSLATLDFNAIGYGIHYEHGLFEQQFHDKRQIEIPDEWREYGNPWEVCRPEAKQEIPLYGHVESIPAADSTVKKVWHAGQTVKGVPWDIPIVGYDAQTVNVLRLWESRASSHFDWQAFNAGQYQNAHSAQTEAETISKVLYPNDETVAGKELRFIQQYFFCACSIKDIIRRYRSKYQNDWSEFANKIVIQLNDTHPAIAILELMRTLIDEYDFQWDKAWKLCQTVFAYTNHTLLPEALEKWSVRMFEKILPRHLEIVYQINDDFLNNEVDKLWPGDSEVRRKLSLVEEGESKKIRMAHLSVLTAFKVNGVAEIHSKLVKQDLFPEFNRLWPEKLTNVTNGITPRRWLRACNPSLSQLIDQHVKGDWTKSLDKLTQLRKVAKDKKFQQQFMAIKRANKVKLSAEIKKLTGVIVDPDAIFDVQIKRLHEYKRQHLNLLHILALYRRLLENPKLDMHPRVFIFGAKAAPGYYLAKEIIYAINCVAEKVNNDARINDKLKVVFLPNYRVSLAEKIIPAADVSEQISTAGKEASGTGNMKLALNGAVTIGTLDGANIEIAEEVGDDNIFIFGNTVDEVKALDRDHYNPCDYYNNNPEIKACLDWLDSDYFTPGKFGELAAIKRSILNDGDPYKVLADFQSYSEQHKQLDLAYKDLSRWARMAIINTAMMGKFTSDRAIEEYARNIWAMEKTKTSTIKVELVKG